MKIKIVNVVATGETGEHIDLDELSKLQHTIYNPEKYRCVYIRDNNMTSKISIFPSGKMIVIGSKSVNSARKDLDYVIGLLRENGILSGTDARFEVRNIVISVDLESEVNLETLQEKVPGAIYEPEQFPGVIVRPKSSNAAVLVFSSGKLVITGLRTSDLMVDVVKKIVNELELIDDH